jgi:aquaporin TIP
MADFLANIQDAVKEKRMQKHICAEAIGTLLYVFLSEAAAVNSDSSGLLTNALGNGLALAVMIYSTAGDNGSGGKLNPAVSTGLIITGRMDRVQYVLEVAAQLVGAFAGSLLLRFSLPGTDLTHPFVAMGGISTGHPLSTFIWEFIATAFYIFVVYATVVDKQTRHPGLKVTLPAPFAPLAIGLAVTVGILACGPFTGGAMNPARIVAAAFVFWNFKNIWVYLLATLLGGIAGAIVYDNIFLEHQPPELEQNPEHV